VCEWKKKGTGGAGGHDMLNGDVKDVLIRLTGPMILGMAAMVAFNLIDTMYVGWLGSDDLAAMAFTFPVVFFYVGVSAGLGVGASSVIARRLGGGHKHEAALLSSDAIILAFTITVIFTTAGLLTIDPLFSAMGAEDDILDKVKSYMTIWYFGMPVVVVPMVGNSIIRATGDTRTPMKIMMAAVVTNLILDPLLIFGPGPFPGMGLAGAATATVIARTVALVLTVRVLFYQKRLLAWEKRAFQTIVSSWKSILHVGAPTAMVNVLTPISLGIITAMVAGYGTKTVAGYGAATRMETMVLMPIIAFCAVLVPFVGQNVGAGKLERVREATVLGYRATALFGLLAFAVLALTARYSARVFNDDPDVIDAYADYLRYAGVGWVLVGASFVASNTFNAMGKPLPSAVLTLVRIFAFMVPLATLGSHLTGSQGLFAGLAGANILGGTVSMLWQKKVLSEEELGPRDHTTMEHG